jgi:hypothetical protein
LRLPFVIGILISISQPFYGALTLVDLEHMSLEIARKLDTDMSELLYDPLLKLAQ